MSAGRCVPARRWRALAATGAALLGLGFVASPARAADAAVVVTRAEVGLFGRASTGPGDFVPSAVLPLVDGQEFGWRLTVKTTRRTVKVVEELTLPAEPKTWGDPEPGLKRRTTADGRTAITERLMVPEGGVLHARWTVTTGDPAGTWVLKLRVDDQPERVFRLQAR